MNKFPREDLKPDLDRLEINFAARGDSPPVTFDEAREHFEHHHSIHPALDTALSGEIADRVYAALMISAFDPERARTALRGLTAESETLLVQDEVGFGSVRIEARFVAENFLQGRRVGEGLVGIARRLENWRGAAWLETRDRPALMVPHLPDVATVLRLISDDPEAASQIARELAESDSLAGKFFAATIFEATDDAARRSLLEELRGDTTELSVRTGDIAILVPARDIAAAMLEMRDVF